MWYDSVSLRATALVHGAIVGEGRVVTGRGPKAGSGVPFLGLGAGYNIGVFTLTTCYFAICMLYLRK